MTDRLLTAVAHLAERRPRAILAVSGLVTAVALALLPRFEIDPDFASFLPEGLEESVWARALEDGDGARTLFVVVEGDDVGATLPDLAGRLRDSPHLEEVAATREEVLGARLEPARAAPLYFLPPEVLDRVERRLTTERAEALAETRRVLAEDPVGGSEIARRDPFGLRWILGAAVDAALPDLLDPASPYLVSRDGRLGFLRLRGRRPPFELDASLALLDDVEERLGDARTQLLGGYAIARADAARMRGDLMAATTSSSILVCLFLAISLRRRRAPLVLLTPTACAIVWTLGFGGALLGPLNPLAASAAAVLLGLGVDFAIHYATRYAEAADPRAAGVATGRLLLWGLLTTLAGFLALLFGRFPGLRAFGQLLSLGLLFAFLATIFLLPILLARFGDPGRGDAPAPVIGALQRLHASRAGPVAAALFFLLAAGGWIVLAIHGLPVDADPSRFRPDDDPLRLAQARFVDAIGFAPLPVTVLVDAAQPIGELRAAAAQLESGDLVHTADGPMRLVPDAAARARVATFRERTAGWIEASAADFRNAGLVFAPFRDGLARWQERFDAPPPEGEVTVARGRRWHRLSLFLPEEPARPRRTALRAAVAAALPGAVLLDPYALGDAVTPRLAAEVQRVLAWAAFAVLLLVLAGSGGPRYAWRALVPVVTGFGLTFGVVALCGWALHPGNFVAVPFLIGLGVDDGIHMAGRFREGSGDPLATSGKAVWRTSATTLLGFGSLAFARTPALASLGGMLALGILACFLASVVLLPRFLR